MGKGEFISFLGPSGCGKTTTLQMIAGFLDPTRGAIRLEDKDLTAIHPAKRGLGIVFQSYALFPHMTAAENVAFGLEMRNVSRAERAERVRAALAMVGLAGYEDRHPRRMSGGQQQRVALARALVIKPSVLLLDEPLSNLDAKLREEMQIELRQIQRTIGTTTILVTHDQNEAMSLSDRIVVMSQGKHRADRHAAGDLREAGLGVRLAISRQDQRFCRRRSIGLRRRRGWWRAPGARRRRLGSAALSPSAFALNGSASAMRASAQRSSRASSRAITGCSSATANAARRS